jgi:hypothetical protein
MGDRVWIAFRLTFFIAGALTIMVPAWAQSPGGMGGGMGNGMGGGMQGPPPEASQACQGKSQGSSCSFETPRGTMQGTCGSPPGMSLSLCMPQGGPPQGGQQMGGPQMGGMGGPQMGGMGGPQMGGMGGPRQMRNSQRGPQMGGPQMGGGGGGRQGADIDGVYANALPVTSRVPDTHQGSCFDTRSKIACPKPGEAFFGQDANYEGPTPSYTDNGDGTVNDDITGLQWQKAHNATRLGYYDAKSVCANLTLGGHGDWRLPNIKELFSLADFRGSQSRHFFINEAFDFAEPGQDVLQGDRFASTHSTQMMGQTWSSTIYTGVHFGRPGVEAAFFYNFLDGHIKQAPTGGRNKLFYRCVRGQEWGANAFHVNGDGTVTDLALGLTWQQIDDGRTRDWPGALQYCENLNLAGHDDWRLPNIKELETLVDYTQNDPALDQRYVRQTDKKGWFWSSTTHGDNISMASYVCFGKCVSKDGVDTHGAGAQRSDPKAGDPSRWTSLGGQQDEVRINNYVRCVR